MHAGARRAAVETGDDVDARIAVRIARCSLGTDELGLEAALAQALADIFGAGPVCLPRRIDGREADQFGGERDQIVDPVVDRPEESFIDHAVS